MDSFNAEVVGGPHCGQAVEVDAEAVNGNGRVRLALKEQGGTTGRAYWYQVISHPGEDRSWVGLHFIQPSRQVSR